MSLVDACTLVSARGRLMQALPDDGVMVAVQASEGEIVPYLGSAVDLAAVNAAGSVVLSGSTAEVEKVAAVFREQGRRTRRLATDRAFHSSLMDPVLDALGEVAAGLSYGRPQLPVVSTVTGGLVTGEMSSPQYWVDHARRPVRFADAVVASRAGVFLEVGPDGVLSGLVDDAVPLLRPDCEEPDQLVAALGEAFTRGVGVDWPAYFAGSGARQIDLPTYPFQRDRYWLTSSASADVSAAGLADAGHPLLGARVELADGGVVLTGRLSLGTQEWLADHAVFGTVLLPGAAFVELALSAGEHVGCPRVEELVLAAPLRLAGGEQVHVQVTVAAADDVASDGRRAVTVYSRRGGGEWTRHATGALVPEVPAVTERLAEWPPASAVEHDVADVYPDLLDRGYAYGPAFQGLRRLWRLGEESFAEIDLAAGRVPDAGAFALHPALLDAAVHPLLPGVADDERAAGLPFAWAGVSVVASDATSLRVRLTPTGPDTVALRMFDTDGAAVATIDALTWRAVAAEDVVAPGGAAAPGMPLFALEWTPVPLAPAETPDWPTWHDAAAEPPTTPVVLAPRAFGPTPRGAARQALALAQSWLAAARPEPTRLVVLTSGAAGPDATDPAGAAAWGLLRSAQSENADRLVLVDADDIAAAGPLLSAVLASGEPQVVVRDGAAFVPRVSRLTIPAAAPAGRTSVSVDLSADSSTASVNSPTDPATSPFPPTGTTLITGGTGVLGTVLARHLVRAHGVRRLLLTSRRGPDAPGARELVEELTELGAVAEIVACDVAERADVARLLTAVPPEHPLTAVVHAAGTADDGVIGSLTPERLDHTLAPKADGAWHLHELTRDAELSAFVLFSSVAATLGAPGQGNYAAANAVLDALSAVRRVQGLPVLTLSWGLWARGSGITGHLSETDLRRIARAGLLPLDDQQGLDLFDAAVATGAPWVLPMRLDLAALRAQRDALPAVLRGLVPATRRAAAGPAGGATLAERLHQVAPEDRERVVADVVRSEIALVLGYAGPEAVDRERAFTDLGFDSLTAIDLRNRLGAATGLRLPATLVFDHPTPDALIGYVRDRTASAPGGARTVLERIDDLGTALGGLEAGMRAEALARLRELLTAADPGARAEAALANASTGEVLDFINRELGISLS
ncbi:hypothetical protein CTZ27_38315 [Streptomyces griseocarneus]|nr:hypothetical protein CTZ27_38315 [Streptomyces griseocarneus]